MAAVRVSQRNDAASQKKGFWVLMGAFSFAGDKGILYKAHVKQALSHMLFTLDGKDSAGFPRRQGVQGTIGICVFFHLSAAFAHFSPESGAVMVFYALKQVIDTVDNSFLPML